MSLQKKIVSVQSKLKAPKGQFNNFGKFNYRSCEDILEAVKPLLADEGLQQTISDKIVHVGDRYYIEATVTVTDGENDLSVTALAREAKSKKKMDSSQITGTASSYARKYALNGLWLIDDTKDADTDAYNKKKTPKKPVLQPGTDRWKKAIDHLAGGKVKLSEVKSKYDVKDLDKLIAESKQRGEDATG